LTYLGTSFRCSNENVDGEDCELKKATKDIEILLCQLLNSEDKVNVFRLRHLLVSSQLVVLVCEYCDMFLLCSVFRLALLMIR
jgi:hypothetical protein